MINQTLRQLGLNEHEISVYLTILEHGKITPAHVANLTKINRTTVYSIAKQLIKQGIISEDLGTANRQLIARPPEDLDILIRRAENDLDQKRYLVKNAITELQKIAKSAQYSIPKIVFIEEEGVRDYLYKQTPAWNKSLLATEPTWWGFQDVTFVEFYEAWIDWYWQESNPTTIDLKLLTNQTDIEDTMKAKNYDRRRIKFWQEAHDFTATTWINGDYIVMIMTRQQPHYLVEIYDKTLAHNFRQMFKGIWQSI